MGRKLLAAVTSLEARQVRFLLLIGWVLFMYLHSMTPAELSTEESSRMLALITGLLDQVGIRNQWLTEHILRKAAHFYEYAVFGLLLAWNLQNHGSRRHRRREPGIGTVYPAALAVLAVPFLDETIQLFVPGRSAQVSDVWLDLAGGCFGILLYHLALKLQSRWKNRRRRRRRRW